MLWNNKTNSIEDTPRTTRPTRRSLWPLFMMKMNYHRTRKSSCGSTGGDPFRQSHTLTVEPKDRLLLTDTWNLASGKKYELTLRKSEWRWLYEDKLEAAVLQDKARLKVMLGEEPQVEWRADCGAEFLAD